MVLVNFTDITKDRVKFKLSACNPAIANALRRILLAEVPCLAIDIVEVKHNTGVMVDEMLSHRLGLVPIVSDLAETLVYPSECKCFLGCSKCSIKLELNKENTGTGVISVYASDIIPENSQGLISPENQKILLTRLGPGQKIHCIMWAKKGIAKSHAKWSTVSTAVYEYTPMIDIPNKVTGNVAKEIVNSCPTRVYEINSSGELDIEDLNKCTFCGECTKFVSTGGKSLVSVLPDESQMSFTVESLGQYPAIEIVKIGIHEMITKLKTVKSYIADTNGIQSTENQEDIEF
jgi:DNA-directed RNA polymerase alpha subunit